MTEPIIDRSVSIDTLVQMLASAGMRVKMKLKKAA